MSKIGKMPIELPEGATFTLEGRNVKVNGVKGDAAFTLPAGITAEVAEGKILITPISADVPNASAMSGLARASIANLVKGVTTGFEKKLELIGVGYRAQMQGETLVLSLGFSHPVKFTPKPGVKLSVGENVVTVAGIYKDEVGELAAVIRAVKPPEPYKGKGIKYAGEHIRRKAGKAAKAVGGK
jgi:large subunit ribosomal protein L6